MDNKQANVTVSFPFVTMLFILFLGLKLGGAISWPWVWVFAPLWIPLAVFTIVVIAALILLASKNE